MHSACVHPHQNLSRIKTQHKKSAKQKQQESSCGRKHIINLLIKTGLKLFWMSNKKNKKHFRSLVM